MRKYVLWSRWTYAIAALALVAAAAQAQDRGETLFNQRCAACHAQGLERAPHLDELKTISADTIFIALTRGSMAAQAAGLSDEDIAAIATHLSGQAPSLTPGTAVDLVNACNDQTTGLNENSASNWQGWGNTPANTRFQPKPGLTPAEVSKLKPKWVFGLPGSSAYGQPTIVGGRVFVTSFAGHVFSLDAKTGCAYWAYDAGTPTRTAMTVAKVKDRWIAVLGDDKAYVHGLDADTGEPLWKTRLDTHMAARITGSPALYQDTVLVSVSSLEEGIGTQSSYGCCTFRGAVAALNVANGKLLWKTHTIPDEPKPIRKNAAGVQQFGPAGAAVWMAPTVDAKRNRVYVGSGNSYTEVSSDYSNAVIAFDLATGDRIWQQQVTPNDNYIVGCRGTRNNGNNCPEEAGPDYDFGASIILQTLPTGQDVLLAGQKSGMVYALDPDHNGKELWRVQVHPGSALGGVQWGMSADDSQLYVSNAFRFGRSGAKPGGLTALKIANGDITWTAPPADRSCEWGRQGCNAAQSQAVSSMPGVVFSGSLDGRLRAYDSASGKVLWEFNTGVAFDAENKIETKGGSLDGGGPTIADGIVYVLSGYGRLGGHGGNALIAFSVDGK